MPLPSVCHSMCQSHDQASPRFWCFPGLWSGPLASVRGFAKALPKVFLTGFGPAVLGPETARCAAAFPGFEGFTPRVSFLLCPGLSSGPFECRIDIDGAKMSSRPLPSGTGRRASLLQRGRRHTRAFAHSINAFTLEQKLCHLENRNRNSK